MNEAIEWFEKNTVTDCSDCHRAYDHTCSGTMASRCHAYRTALKKLKENTQISGECSWCKDLENRPCHACSKTYDHFDCGEGHPGFKLLPYKHCPECGRKL